MPALCRLVLSAGVLGACLGSPAFAQSNIAFLKDSPVAQFTEEDFSKMHAAATEVVEGNQRGLTRSWSNDATGNSGSIRLLQSFKATDGRDCRRLRVQNKARAIEGTSTLNVCRGTDGKWLLDAGARPAPSP